MTDRRKGDATTASQAQHARFLETARALGCDEDEEAFDEKLKAIARHKSKEGTAAPETKKAPIRDAE